MEADHRRHLQGKGDGHRYEKPILCGSPMSATKTLFLGDSLFFLYKSMLLGRLHNVFLGYSKDSLILGHGY